MFPKSRISVSSKSLFCVALILLVGVFTSSAQSKKEQISILTAERDSLASALSQSANKNAELLDTLDVTKTTLSSSIKHIATLNDSIALNQKRLKEVRAAELQAREEIKRGKQQIESLQQATAKTLADSLSVGQQRYKSARNAEAQAREEAKHYKQQVDSLLATTANATSKGLIGLNQTLRGDWEQFRDGVLQKFDPTKMEALELAFLNLEDLNHHALESDIDYRTQLLTGYNMIEQSKFERFIGFHNSEFIEVSIREDYMQPSGALGISFTNILLDKTTGEMTTWADLVLEGHSDAVSDLFAKKSRALLGEITECVGDRETAELMISSFSDLTVLSYGDGSLYYDISMDSDGVNPCTWSMAVGMNELRSHLSPRLYK